MKAILLLAAAVVLLTGCVPAMQPPVDRIAFPEAEYAALAKTGTAVVNGQAFLKTRGGDVKTAAGEDVMLNPVTSYSQQWAEVAYLGGRDLTAADSRYAQYVRTTTANAEGRFTFTDVPPGDYYLTATVVWDAPTGYQGALRRQGGLVSQRITVKDGDKLDIVLTR